MAYWLDLFTGTTWKEFRDAGARITGFRKRMRNAVARMKKGDILLCYLTGVMRWVGALEVIRQTTEGGKIWSTDDFPERLEVKPLVELEPEYGVPMKRLEGKVDFYEGPQHLGKYKGFIRQSPNQFRRSSDGDLILELMRDAERNPVAIPVDPRKLARKPLYKVELRKGKAVVPTVVSVPEAEELPEQLTSKEPRQSAMRHVEIQHALLALGAEMGLDVWVARNDRSRTHDGVVLGDMANMLSELPTQFNDATNRTIELIDVLWLKGNTFVAAFEVEVTTSVYSGLLRMSDLLALQPNLDIRLYLVAPDDGRAKVEQEIRRPTFALRDRPLRARCGYLSFSTLMEKIEAIRRLRLASSLKPDFLKDAAEYFLDDDDDDGDGDEA